MGEQWSLLTSTVLVTVPGVSAVFVFNIVGPLGKGNNLLILLCKPVNYFGKVVYILYESISMLKLEPENL